MMDGGFWIKYGVKEINSMNYFEAYRIVQAYTKALAMPKSKYDIYCFE